MPVISAIDITRRLPPEILTVGVFRDEHPDRVIELCDRSGVKAAQLHGRETPDQVAQVARSVRHVIKAVAAGTDAAITRAAFVPRLLTQIYDTSPLLRQLLVRS